MASSGRSGTTTTGRNTPGSSSPGSVTSTGTRPRQQRGSLSKKENAEMSNFQQLKDYVEETLYPEMYKHLDKVFPEMGFKSVAGRWQSGLKLDGTEPKSPRRDKTVVKSSSPKRALEAGGESVSLIDLYMSLNRKDFIEAVKGISSILGLSLPEMADSEEYKAYRQKLDTLQRVASTMAKDLRSKPGEKVLQYLKGVRGYDDAFIDFASFGYVSRQSADELRKVFAYQTAEGERNALPYDVGEAYTLAIPYHSGGNIKGFAFRTIREDVKPKYKDAFLSGRESKKYHLFGLSGLRLTGNAEKDRDIVVVEGEIDALRAQYSGISNVVAASGGEISSEAVLEAQKRGVERITILFDREDSPEAQSKLRTKIQKAIGTIRASGLRAMVAEYEDGPGKMDADTYLSSHSPEDLSSIIEGAQTGALYLYRKYLAEAIEATPGGMDGAPTDRIIEELKRKTLELVNDTTLCSPTDSGVILSLLSNDTGGVITRESLKKEAEDAFLLANERKQGGELRTALSDAIRMSDAGNHQGAIDYLRQRLEAVSEYSTEAKYRSLFSTPSREETIESFSSRLPGIETPYYFGGERLSIPSGALTYICAPTSHGKTRLLENLALSISDNGNAGDTLFFSYEEDATAVRLQMLNIYAGITLTDGNNIKTIEDYYRDGNTRYFKAGTLEVFKRKAEEYFSLLSSGKLRIFYEPLYSDELAGAIRYAARNGRIKAVFVDYVQRLHKRGSKRQRKDELKDICEDLMAVSVETGIPVILGAQLNREALSPLEMTVQNITEASDIEQSANVVLLLWNSKVKPQPKSSAYYSDRNSGKLSQEADALRARGFNIGVGGKMYAILAKNRGGERNIDAILDFDGNIGSIKSPESEKKKREEPQQGEITFDM